MPERQRTMRSTLDWSHDLLSGPRQELFRRLSVFAGEWTLEAAETVGAAGNVDTEAVIVLLGELAEHALVITEQDPGGSEVHYGMLEPVRQYALERLEESGETQETRRRHAALFIDLRGSGPRAAGAAAGRVAGPAGARERQPQGRHR